MDAVSMSFLRSITLQHLLLFTNQDVLWIPLVTVFNGSFKIWVWLVKSLVSSVQFLSHVCLYVTPWITACQAFLSITNSWSLLRLMSIESVMPSNHLILCHPFVLPPSIFSSIRVFSNESFLCIRWPKYWSFSFSINPSNEFSSVQSLSHVRLCDTMNHRIPGLPVHHQISEFTQTHVLWVGDAIQPSHPLSSPSPPAFNLSQHQGLLKWVSSSHQVAKVLQFQL